MTLASWMEEGTGNHRLGCLPRTALDCNHALRAPPRNACAQLLHQSMPAAAVLLAALVPAFEPVGLPAAANGFVWGAPGTLLGYQFTAPAVFAIVGSAALG